MLKFTKMVATGNDFIMIDNRRNVIYDRDGFARKYCDRHFGIGADGVIFIETLDSLPRRQAGRLSTLDDLDFRMRIFNPDGSEAEMCGNGARCAAVFARLKHIVKKNKMRFQTLAGIISADVINNGARIGMSEPTGIELNKKISAGGRSLIVNQVNTGVPHAVLIGKNIENIDIMKVAPPIRHHRSFPRGVNVDFVRIVNRSRIQMRTYERGVEGETLACGTGATASAIISSLLGYAKSPVEVAVKGGILKVYFRSIKCSTCAEASADRQVSSVRDVYLEGEAKVVYEGEI
jgi:diaminopimelate epimerase